MPRMSSSSAYLFSGAVVLAASFAVWSGCAKSKTAKQQVVAPTAVTAAATATGRPLDHAHGSGVGKVGEIALFVDGKPTAIVRISELPLGLKRYARPSPSGDGMTSARFFRLYDYLTALGIDAAKIKTIHFHGSWGRVAAVDGDELVKYKEDLLFDFTGEDYGKPRMRWSTDKLRTPTNIDIFQAVAVYIDKKAPTYSVEEDSMMLDGKPVEGPAYVEEKIPKGTRVYVDGKLLGAAKRRQMSRKILAKNDDTHSRYSFDAYLGSLGVDLAKVKAVDFVSGDSLAFRASAKDIEKDTLTFDLGNHMHGKVEGHFPGDKAATVSSVQVFTKAAPPAREVDPDTLDSESDWEVAKKQIESDDAQETGLGDSDSDE